MIIHTSFPTIDFSSESPHCQLQWEILDTISEIHFPFFMSINIPITIFFIVVLLQEEPGGQRALIFDQGNRISRVGPDSSPDSSETIICSLNHVFMCFCAGN